MIAVWSVAAWCMGIDDVFPRTLLTREQARERLDAEHIGPPAVAYDERTTTASAATEVEQQLESALGLGDIAASDAHRRFNRLVLALRRTGELQHLHTWFLAEHVGLAGVPVTGLEFMTGSGEPSVMLPDLRKSIESMRKDSDLRSIAVTVVKDEEAGWVGLVSALYGAARFDSFPRVVTPGKMAVIPGTLLDDKQKYALYVTWPGTEVREFPLAAAGEFDIEVPVPTEPGRYRVVLQSQRKRSLPDSPFFLTLYVGTEPPTAFVPEEYGLDDDRIPGRDELEQSFIDQLNAVRATFDLPQLAPIEGAAPLRTLLAGLPEGERQRWRYVQKALTQDPIPAVAHGQWAPLLSSGRGAAEVAWSIVEHPAIRADALDPQYTLVAVGAVDPGSTGDYVLLGVLARPAEATADSRQRTWDLLASNWQSPDGPKPAPALEARLDTLAAEIASGKRSMKSALKAVKTAAKDVHLSGSYQTSVYQVPTGDLPDLGAAPIAPLHRYLAIGDASYVVDGGITVTVLLIVTAERVP